MKADLYDPLTYDNLMAGLVLHFEKQEKTPLTRNRKIAGPGIYSLFYTGALSVYEPISKGIRPIYTGKAIPPGAKKGGAPNTAAPALQRRLSEHARSIEVKTIQDAQQRVASFFQEESGRR